MILSLFSPQRALPTVSLAGTRVFLRVPCREEAQEWVELRRKNAAAQAPFSPLSSFSDLTPQGYAKRLARYHDDWREGTACAFSIIAKDTGALLGGLTLNNIIRGAGQMTTLGYWLDEDARGKGLMPEAVMLACGFAFESLHLHRVQAGCLPHNSASRRVLEKCGFREEGLARKYIKIAGEWQDHVIYALLKEDLA